MKKFKTKHDLNKIRIIILIIIFLILFILLSLYKAKNSYKKVTNILLNDFNKEESLINLSFLTSNLDYLFNNYSFYNESIVYNEIKPAIYLYNTHDTEKYIDNKTIGEATIIFKDNLKKLGIEAIYEVTKPSELLTTGLSYYDISRSLIKQEQEKNKDITYFIDVHRDSVSNTTIKINNKNYAKILFVLGIENKNYLKNKSIMLKMNDYLNKNYPGISRGIYEKKGSGVDGVYNQDLGENVLLIEIGGVKNSLEEVSNSTEILSLMIYHMIGD